jgi:hypothetical protein
VAAGEEAPVALEEVGQGRVVEDRGGGVTDVEEQLEEARVEGFGPHPAGQLGGVAEGGERAVEEPHDVADDDLGGTAGEAVPPFPSPPARHDPGVLEGQEDRLEELLGNPLPLGDLVRREDPPVPPFREVDERLKGVETALGDLQKYPYGNYRILEGKTPASSVGCGGRRRLLVGAGCRD